MSSGEQTAQRLTEPSIASTQCRQCCASTLDQDFAQVFAAAFADTEQTLRSEWARRSRKGMTMLLRALHLR
jgi:hypothetical protein